MNDTTPVLETRGVTVRFGGVVALDAVDFHVAPASIVGLVGPNGAGKTTLFEVVSGFRRLSSGTVRLDGHDVTPASPQERARRGLARTFQRLELFPELTVREHLLLAHRSRHRPRFLADLVRNGRESTAERAVVDDILDQLGLGSRAQELAATLPLGVGRLVEVGRALAAQPRTILLDEPSSGLDEVETDRLVGALRAMHAQHGIALAVVEHNLNLVLGLCDEVQVLDFGRTIARGTPAEIRTDENVQAAYIGTAA